MSILMPFLLFFSFKTALFLCFFSYPKLVHELLFGSKYTWDLDLIGKDSLLS